jgi:glutaconyl-CoA/methylmalonyl-CoA decarboxylase subunit gamma
LEEITMKKFNITVNGKSYEVDVEEIGGVSARPVAAPSAPAPSAPAPKAAAPKAAPAQAAAPAPVPTGGETVVSPMPGTILDIKVAVGDSIASGDVLVILEAMKMENEIMAPCAGKVLSINCNKGASVNSGDVLVVIG